MLKRIFMLLLTALLLPWSSAQAGGRILFIPHDDRPISYHQTIHGLGCLNVMWSFDKNK